MIQLERKLRKQYAEALEKFHYYERGLLIAKQELTEHAGHHLFLEDELYHEAQLPQSLAEYKSYKFVVKCMSKELRELKDAIKEYDRQHSQRK